MDKTTDEFDEDDQKAFIQEIKILQKTKELSDYLVSAIDVRETVKEIYIMMTTMMMIIIRIIMIMILNSNFPRYFLCFLD